MKYGCLASPLFKLTGALKTMLSENSPTPTAPSARRFALRNGTWATHQLLDSQIGTLNTPAAYKRYLYTVYLLRSGIEETLRLTPWPEQFGTWRPSPLSPALLSDMQDLGLTPSKAATFPRPLSASALLGALYVVEGAALGARLLIKQAAALGFNAQFGARHLAQQTASNQEWTTYLTLLETAANFNEAEAITAAQNVFSFGLAALHLADHAAEQIQHG